MIIKNARLEWFRRFYSRLIEKGGVEASISLSPRCAVLSPLEGGKLGTAVRNTLPLGRGRD